jgi:hypothetical protein
MMVQARKKRSGKLSYFAFLASLALLWPTLPCMGAGSSVAVFRVPATWQTAQGPQLPSKAKSPGSFDKPIKTVTVDIAPSPRNHNTPGKLYCHYYPHVLVKEYAQDEHLGADLSILRTQGTLPACKLSHERGERAIDWNGVFKGVKDTLVFLDGGDAFDGALSFAVYDSATGKKLFADWAYDESTPAHLFSRVQVFPTNAGYLLKYLSVAEVDCDLHLDGRTCWEKVKAKLDLKTDHMPVCTGYEHISDLFGTDHVPSRVAYPVEVTLSPHPVVRTVAGPVECWPTQ